MPYKYITMVNIKILWYYQLKAWNEIGNFCKVPLFDTEHYITLFTNHTKPTSITDRKWERFQPVNQFHMSTGCGIIRFSHWLLPLSASPHIDSHRSLHTQMLILEWRPQSTTQTERGSPTLIFSLYIPNPTCHRIYCRIHWGLLRFLPTYTAHMHPGGHFNVC